MIISYKHKFIFLHLKKTGGTSITRNLLPFLGKNDIILGCLPQYEKEISIGETGRKLNKHSDVDDIKSFVGDNVWNSFFKFAFVRNPYDMLVSLYFWWHKTPANWSESSLETKKTIISQNFEEFIHNGISISPNYFTKSICEQSEDKELFTEVDFIGHYETLQEDFNFICKKIDFPRINLSQINRSSDLRDGKEKMDFYSEEMKLEVQELFRDDFSFFNYPL